MLCIRRNKQIKYEARKRLTKLGEPLSTGLVSGTEK